LQKKQYFETDMDVVIPPLTPKKQPVSKSMDSDEQSDLYMFFAKLNKIRLYSMFDLNVYA